MRQRHAVRQYLEKGIEAEKVTVLENKIRELNAASGLHFQFIQNERKAFSGLMARFAKFSGVSNYFVLVGEDKPTLKEKCGYYGEQLVLYAQQIGLNTCWAMTFKRINDAYLIEKGEKLCLAIAVGYGQNQGVQHVSKKLSEVSNVQENSPRWFIEGVEAALLAPTARNKQQFYLNLIGDKVQATANSGVFSDIDLGIIKLHFEIGSGKGSEVWT